MSHVVAMTCIYFWFWFSFWSEDVLIRGRVTIALVHLAYPLSVVLCSAFLANLCSAMSGGWDFWDEVYMWQFEVVDLTPNVGIFWFVVHFTPEYNVKRCLPHA